ncbi:MAG: alanine--tRNA ligase [Chloroflexota bacterium]|nr:alanine--tRNA ligase [Chloroflexota bacterium]
MNPMDSETIRQTFVDYFVRHGHQRLPSASLIPTSDTGSLLTIAGMQQITPFFLGLDQSPAPRLVTVQKCFRAPDIEEVGDERHTTFFEMLGNFSVGDYFKEDATRFAYDLLTNGYGIDPARLYPSIHPDDSEARACWRDIGFPPERIVPLEENWWSPGPVGPNGPDSEVYIDRGHLYGKDFPAGGPDRDDRYLETWNLVFIQYARAADGENIRLASPHIDTGMGLERLAMIVQGVPTVYETDLYEPIIMKAAEVAGVMYGRDAKVDHALRVIADHSRGVTFLIGDGVLPSNEGRGYVLRRVLRRLIRQGRLLGIERPFATETVGAVIAKMGRSNAYPELREREAHILRVVEREEETFGRTLAAGLGRFATLTHELQRQSATEIPGEQAFRLYDTFGFPPDLTRELAGEQGLTIDEPGFERAMLAQREMSRSHAAFDKAAMANMQTIGGLGLTATTFLGYETTEADATIVAIIGDEGVQEGAEAGETVVVFLDRTPFYGESGGQVGDTGLLTAQTGIFAVVDTKRPNVSLVAHRGQVMEGSLRVGDDVHAAVDFARRAAIRRNHTATHLLHRALHIVLGEHAKQAGSLVAPDRLRFDFTHSGAMTGDELRRVAEIASDHILADTPVETTVMAYDTAVAGGATALFGEKYGDTVRVVRVGDYSKELCGGTHVSRTGEIGPLVILGEESSAAGVRRIEAMTGVPAIAYIGALQTIVRQLAAEFRGTPEELPDRVHAQRDQLRVKDREIERLRRLVARASVSSLLDQATGVDGARILVARAESGDLGTLGDQLRDHLGTGVIVLGSMGDGKATLLAIVSDELIARGISAGAILQEIAPFVGGRGGGREARAQGGGPNGAALDAALDAARTHLAARLG